MISMMKSKSRILVKMIETAQLISAFVFTMRIVQPLYYLNPKFQASSHLLWLYSPVCVRPGRTPRRTVFSQRGSNEPAKMVPAVQIINATPDFRIFSDMQRECC